MGKERQRNRIKSRVDELPDDIRELLDEMLADVNYSYKEIADEITDRGFNISKSAVGRYAIRQNAISKRLKEVAEQTRVIVEAAQNNNFDAVGATTSMLTAGLARKIATAQEEIDNMPIDKAARLVVQLERSAVYREKFRLQYEKGVKEAIQEVKKELQAELEHEPELLLRMDELAERVAARMEKRNQEG